MEAVVYDINSSVIHRFPHVSQEKNKKKVLQWQFQKMPMHVPTISGSLITACEKYASLSHPSLAFIASFSVSFSR